MLVNIQAPSVAKLLWEMLEEIPLDKREIHAPQVDKAASLFEHPNLNGAVLLVFSSDGALQPTCAL